MSDFKHSYLCVALGALFIFIAFAPWSGEMTLIRRSVDAFYIATGSALFGMAIVSAIAALSSHQREKS